MTVKTSFGVSDANASFIISTGTGDITITDAANGKFTVTVPRSATIALAELNFIYDITVVIGSGHATIFRGNLELFRNVSDS